MNDTWARLSCSSHTVNPGPLTSNSNLYPCSIKQVHSPRPVGIDSVLLFTWMEKKKKEEEKNPDGLNIFHIGEGGCGFNMLCVFVRAYGILFCPRPFLPVSSPPRPSTCPLSFLTLLSLQPASPQTGGQATPLRSACCERRVTEPDTTTNCSRFEEIKHFCLFWNLYYLLAFSPSAPPPTKLTLYAKQWISSRLESHKLGL